MKTDSDMKPEYDFSKEKRKTVIPNSGKTRVTTYLDNDVLAVLKALGESEKKGYQTVCSASSLRQKNPLLKYYAK